tara:strand:+ start:123106 stop:123825 length:720 start_codon:yes stop_codon:yes gene_type:complete
MPSLKSTTIVQRLIDSENDNKFKMSGSNISRIMDIGGSWNTLRIGLRLAFVQDASATTPVTGTPRFYFGVGNGSSSPIGAESPVHFVGLYSNETEWTLKATGNDCYGATGTTSGFDFKAMKVVDGVVTESASSVALGSVSAQPDVARACLFIEIVKGSPFTVKLYAPNDAGTDTDTNLDAFFSVMEESTMSALANYALSGAKNVTVDESTDGTLNAFQCSWDRTLQKVEISDVAYARVN